MLRKKKVIKKIIFGLDLDGVILDHSNNKIELARNLGYKLLPEETPSDILETKISKGALREISRDLYDSEKLARKTPLIIGAKNGLHYLKSEGVPFVLISRRRNTGQEAALISLKLHGLWPDYFDTTNSFFVVEKKDKDVKAKEIGVTHFVDDEPSVIKELISVPQRFLFDPLLAYSNLSQDFKRIFSWDEIISLVNN